MSEIKALGELEGLVQDINECEINDHIIIERYSDGSTETGIGRDWVCAWREAALRQLHAIEREIAERYMELPTDADGVPIKVGDELCGYGRLNGGVTVSAVTGWGGIIVTDKGMTCNPAKDGLLWDGQACRHIKPRTLEDVLRDCCNEWNKHLGSDWEVGVYAKYADEIRELLGMNE